MVDFSLRVVVLFAVLFVFWFGSLVDFVDFCGFAGLRVFGGFVFGIFG